ncbi:MAG: glycosyltransferase family 2 protein [Candidatus Omnitrophota bacterium]
MHFKYSRRKISGKEKRLERFLEVLPGAISWTVIIGICLLSILKPLAAAVLMIAFLLYWLLRLIYMNIFLIASYLRLAIEKDNDWIKCIQAVDKLKKQESLLCNLDKSSGFKNKISTRMHRKQLEKLKKSRNLPPLSKDIYQLVIIPVISESQDVVEPGVRAIKEGKYPPEKFLIIIALEESAPDLVKKDMNKIQKKYRDVFFEFLIIRHPENQPGEAKVKGANATHAAREGEKYLKKYDIPFENVLVSCFDADTVANPNYFSCLTYHYMISPHRLFLSYQPIPVYHNNIWQAPAFARIIDIGISFFQLIEATNPGKLVTFSSHSMSFKALKDVGYWPVDMISDDSAIFWKAFIHYQGKYQVVPIYTTVSMDIATGPTTVETFKSIYKQKRRWAWGIENFPIVVRGFLHSKRINLKEKISYGYKLLDAFISWSTWSFLILFGSWLPVFFASREFASSSVYYTAPRIKESMFSLASIGLLVCMVISLLLLPREETRYGFLLKVKHSFEWLLIPIVLLFLSAIPALDAQTRLMFGKHMKFWITEKYRKKKK